MTAATLRPLARAAAVALLFSVACDGNPTGTPPQDFLLTVVLSGVGDGVVVSAPAGISCGGGADVCAASFTEGTQVTLSAAPEGGSTFTGWTGAGSGAAERILTLSAPATVTAEFDHPARAAGEIGASGGTLVSRDGRLTLDFPAGALSTMERIVVETVTADDLGAEYAALQGEWEVGAAYWLEPSGLSFAAPVTLSLVTDQDARSEGGVAVEPEFLTTLDGSGVIPLDSLRMEIDAGTGAVTVRGEIGHFSPAASMRRVPDFGDSGRFDVRFEVPATAFVGVEFQGVVTAQNDNPVLSLETSTYGSHNDGETSPGLIIRNVSPVQRLGSPSGSMGSVAEQTLRGVISYTCLFSGMGIARVVVTGSGRTTVGLLKEREVGLVVVAGQEVACLDPPLHMLTVELTGDGDATVTSDPEGLECTSVGGEVSGVCQYAVPQHTQVTLYSTSAVGTRAADWDGCSETGTDAEQPWITWCNIEVPAALQIHHNATVGTELLTVTRTGTGSGRVTSTDDGGIGHHAIDCGETCSASFPIFGSVTLTAMADPGSEFVGFGGECEANPVEPSTSNLRMDGPRECTAEFAALPTLTVTVIGEGAVTVDPPGETCGEGCSAHPGGTVATLTATPASSDWEFTVWGGACSGEEPVTTVVVQSDTECTGTFTSTITGHRVRVAIVTEGAAGGRVLSVPAGIDCSGSGGATSGVCEAGFDADSDVHLAAGAGEESVFTGWLGHPDCGRAGYCKVAMTADVEVTATFAPRGEAEPRVVSLGNNLTNVESTGLVSWRLPFTTALGGAAGVASFPEGPASPDCPMMMVAGTGGAVIVEECSGDLITEFPRDKAVYDAIPLPRPQGETGAHAVLLSGDGYSLCPYDDRGELDGFCQFSFGTNHYTDAVALGSPAIGAILVNNSWRRLDIARYMSGSGYAVVDEIDGDPVPANVQSAVSNARGDKLLVVGNGNPVANLMFVDMTKDPIPAVGFQIAVGARRIRCDLDSQLCAISFYASATSTRQVGFFIWDGETNPRLAPWNYASVNGHGLANGPVGIDIFENRIVTAGYADNQYSIITVDIEDPDLKFTIVTAAVPEGCTNPGHAIFLRDSRNSVAVSCNGSDVLAIIPDAF